MKSPAKINLTLDVVKKIKKYHIIKSIVVKVNLFDEVDIIKNKTGKIEIKCTNKEIPIDSKNTVHKALDYLRAKYKICDGFSVKIKKNIPTKAGLGGASSNAAMAIIWFTNNYKIRITKRLINQLSKISADIPLFLKSSNVLVKGYGQRVKSIKGVLVNDFYLVKAKKGISAKEAYSKLNVEKTNSTKKLTKKIKRNLHLDPKNFFNAFDYQLENISQKIYNIKQKLLKFPFEKVMLVGSGSTFMCFGKLSQKEIAKLKKDFYFVKKVKVL